MNETICEEKIEKAGSLRALRLLGQKIETKRGRLGLLKSFQRDTGKVLFILPVLLTRILHAPIHALQTFLFGRHFVAVAFKKMPSCLHLNSTDEVNVEAIKRKMKEVRKLSYLL